jgi:hypothetical protein
MSTADLPAFLFKLHRGSAKVYEESAKREPPQPAEFARANRGAEGVQEGRVTPAPRMLPQLSEADLADVQRSFSFQLSFSSESAGSTGNRDQRMNEPSLVFSTGHFYALEPLARRGRSPYQFAGPAQSAAPQAQDAVEATAFGVSNSEDRLSSPNGVGSSPDARRPANGLSPAPAPTTPASTDSGSGFQAPNAQNREAVKFLVRKQSYFPPMAIRESAIPNKIETPTSGQNDFDFIVVIDEELLSSFAPLPDANLNCSRAGREKVPKKPSDMRTAGLVANNPGHMGGFDRYKQDEKFRHDVKVNFERILHVVGGKNREVVNRYANHVLFRRPEYVSEMSDLSLHTVMTEFYAYVNSRNVQLQ